eukprot:TRINITY_DN4867_c0_g1_i2.p1 TRINITY_DN4867_c0_g1~~TRINITY_DN4867_c0_g1_i2.p1  ORF type:complete len:416 (+),score=74.53 TRINITY_DN4867_c0_g1_i2:32-1279(+)
MKVTVVVLLALCVCAFAQLQCSPGATYHVAESIPIGLNFETTLSTYQALKNVISSAKKTIDIACFYFTLTEGFHDYPAGVGGIFGYDIYKSLIDAHSRGIKIRVVQLLPSSDFPDTDSLELAKEGIIELRNINWTELVGAGILHTKLMISDDENAYMGSANMDWRSLAQVKELGIQVLGCPLIANDLHKEFEMYWQAANMTALPKQWQISEDTQYNVTNPAHARINDTSTQLYIAASPPEFQTPDRTADIDALVHAINSAEKSVCIEVMDYCPCTLYNDDVGKPNFYWGNIDDALRSAAFRGVSVRFLTAKWNHTYAATLQYFESLNELENVEVKMFSVPPQPNQEPVPFTRVNHAKFMVTDKQTYVGTSNWSADYFINTGGMSFNWFSDDLTNQVQAIFDRDWNSEYVVPCCSV